MKKATTIILATVMSLSLAACGSNTTSVDNNISNNNENATSAISEVVDEETEEEIPEPTPEPTPEPIAEFIASTELEVVYAYTYDNRAYIVVENTSDKVVQNFIVSYTGFDRNGFPVTSNKYDTGRAETVNLLPNEKHIVGFSERNAQYVVATVQSIDFIGGTKWAADNIDLWADEAIAAFTIQSYADMIEQLAPAAKEAEANPYLSLRASKASRNRYSTKDDIDFTLDNISDTPIQTANFMVLQFDENGFPVSVSPYDRYVQNARGVGGNVNLTSGGNTTLSSNLFFSPTTEKYKVIVWEIEFIDGDVWKNPYAFEWLIVNSAGYID